MGMSTCSNFKLAQGHSDIDLSQVNVRFSHWRNRRAVIQYTPLTGMDPGHHSGLINPLEGKQAHITLIDWGTQSGILDVAPLAACLFSLIWWVVCWHQYELEAMLLELCFS